MKTSHTLRATIALAALTASVPAASARTWLIHEDGLGDAPTIQAGIDSAAVGDTVVVSPGTYAEGIDFGGKDVVLESLSGPVGTVLTGPLDTSEPVVWFRGEETRNAVLRGFTISTDFQPGIVIVNSEPSIQENIIENNCGGISCGTDTDTIRRPLIRDNIIRNNGGDPAIRVQAQQAPEIANNLISENFGGGILLFTTAPGATITGNTILGNASGQGAGIYAQWNGQAGNSEYSISWNLIAGNRNVPLGKDPVAKGSGLYLNGTGAWVHHNTLFDEPENSWEGGVVMLEDETGLILGQNIIVFAPGHKGIVCVLSDAQLRNNLVWSSWPDKCNLFSTENGNVVADPAFCDPENRNYSLAQNSPAITHEAGPLGAIPIPGCGPVAVRPSTWGKIKSMYEP